MNDVGGVSVFNIGYEPYKIFTKSFDMETGFCICISDKGDGYVDYEHANTLLSLKFIEAVFQVMVNAMLQSVAAGFRINESYLREIPDEQWVSADHLGRDGTWKYVPVDGTALQCMSTIYEGDGIDTIRIEGWLNASTFRNDFFDFKRRGADADIETILVPPGHIVLFNSDLVHHVSQDRVSKNTKVSPFNGPIAANAQRNRCLRRVYFSATAWTDKDEYKRVVARGTNGDKLFFVSPISTSKSELDHDAGAAGH